MAVSSFMLSFQEKLTHGSALKLLKFLQNTALMIA